MISEIDFSKGFLSFWETIAPYIKSYMNICNLDLSNFTPTKAKIFSPTNRKPLLSELAFRLFCKELIYGTESLTTECIKEIKLDAIQYISRFADSNKTITTITQNEIEEATWLKNNLLYFFSTLKFKKSEIIVSPFFAGCGIIDSCFGDIIVGDTLFEIKSVERNFQAPDMRQLLTYVTLNSASNQYNIKNICLLNPRKCTYYTDNISTAIRAISGKNSDWMINEIINLISSGELSK